MARDGYVSVGLGSVYIFMWSDFIILCAVKILCADNELTDEETIIKN